MFDGIRFSIEMADIAHGRLRETLNRLSDAADGPNEDVARALEDAWSIIDSAARLTGLLQQAPGITHKDRWPSIRQLLVDMTDSISALRNVFQHPNHDVGKRVHRNWPLFGILHWFRLDPDGNSGRISSLMSGTIHDGERPLMNIHGKKIYEPPLGMIELETEGATVSITELMQTIKRIAGDLESSLTPQGTRKCADSLVHQNIRFCDPS